MVLAVPWDRVPGALQGLQWNGRIMIDATNDFAGTDFEGEESALVGRGVRSLPRYE